MHENLTQALILTIDSEFIGDRVNLMNYNPTTFFVAAKTEAGLNL
ncbi:MAG TPA: hypothetical protein V6C71_05175 [Coleofasciculaceae cyanobacterium]|jgi:hypothetical protein